MNNHNLRATLCSAGDQHPGSSEKRAAIVDAVVRAAKGKWSRLLRKRGSFRESLVKTVLDLERL